MSKLLYENKDGSVCIRLDNGRMKSVPSAKFRHEQIVRTSEKHYSQKDFTMVLKPTWSEVRGWIYGERYISRDGSNGGCGWWNNEELYEPLSNPADILIAKKLALEAEIKGLEGSVKCRTKQLEKIRYALSVISGQ